MTQPAPVIAVGDEVRVFDVNGPRVGQPAGGWVGRVTKIGRVNAHIEYPGAYPGATDAFRLATRTKADAYGHRTFQTPAEVEAAQRLQRARGVLRDAGLTVEYGTELDVETLEELAAVIVRRASGTVRHEAAPATVGRLTAI